jgi:hypothetical protein
MFGRASLLRGQGLYYRLYTSQFTETPSRQPHPRPGAAGRAIACAGAPPASALASTFQRISAEYSYAQSRAATGEGFYTPGPAGRRGRHQLPF